MHTEKGHNPCTAKTFVIDCAPYMWLAVPINQHSKVKLLLLLYIVSKKICSKVGCVLLRSVVGSVLLRFEIDEILHVGGFHLN